MEAELTKVLVRTMDAHRPPGAAVTRERYAADVMRALAEEVRDAPSLDTLTGPLATYMKLSVLVLAIVRALESYGLSEAQIGERIYATADAYFRLSPVRRVLRRALFFSPLNRRQIRQRERATMASVNGVNGFQLRYIAATDGFGVDYLACGICDHYSRRGRFQYVKYLCLVDYAIMKHMGVPFSRTTTLGNGGPKCDFRFSHAGPIVEGWPPEALLEWRGASGTQAVDG